MDEYDYYDIDKTIETMLDILDYIDFVESVHLSYTLKFPEFDAERKCECKKEVLQKK